MHISFFLYSVAMLYPLSFAKIRAFSVPEWSSVAVMAMKSRIKFISLMTDEYFSFPTSSIKPMRFKWRMYIVQEDRVNESPVSWLNNHPEVIRELRRRN